MSILITGANGQLGLALQRVLKQESLSQPIISLNPQELDITNAKAIKQVFAEYQPKWVLNTAAFTAVDAAETQQENAFLVNVEAVRYLAQECERHHAKLFHFSSDYVFDGKKQTPYQETDVCAPLSVYGQSKWLGEKAIQETTDNYVILRSSWIFSADRTNFVKTIIRLLAERDQLRIINDQFGCPTYAQHIASISKQLITNYPELSGIFHYSDEAVCTWYDFACAIQEQLVNDYHHQAKDILLHTK